MRKTIFLNVFIENLKYSLVVYYIMFIEVLRSLNFEMLIVLNYYLSNFSTKKVYICIDMSIFEVIAVPHHFPKSPAVKMTFNQMFGCSLIEGTITFRRKFSDSDLIEMSI